MATRRRTSLEAREVNALPMRGGKLPFTQEAYDDFRRRHSRQNKEIIAENALRKTTINALQTEIASLHNELLGVRRANLYLHAQVKRVKSEQNSVLGKATTEVLNQLLSAMPLLQQLRDHITSTPPDTKPPIASRQFMLRSTENPVATRPAASGAVNVVLGALTEASEHGNDTPYVPFDPPVTVIPPQTIRRQSGILSTTTPRLSLPGQTGDGDSCPLSAFPNSPSLTSFPRSPSLVRIAGRRRESGHFMPPPKALFPSQETSSPAEQTEPFGLVPPPPASGVTARRKGRASSAVTTVKSREVVGGLNSDSEASPSPPPELEAEPKGDEAAVVVTLSDRGFSSKPSSSSSASSSTVPAQPTGEVADGGLRGRRVRSSVNYKEPSLTKKMRKPDGLSLEETLKKSYSRQSLDVQSAQEAVAPAPQRVIGSSSTRIGDLRRKSILPKSGIHPHDKDEETDEEEVDSFLDLAMGGMELDEEDFACASPDTRPTPAAREPTLAPSTAGRQAAAPTPRKSPSRAVGMFKASSGRPATRVSPRKKPIVPTSKRPLSVSPPELPRSQAAQKAKPRDALSDLNYNPKATGSKSTAGRKSALPRDTTKVTARRRLTSLA